MINEIRRDDSLDYLNVLKSLNEIPFPLGRNNLIDFLKGEINNSIKKNNLYVLHNFGALKDRKKEDIRLLVENLIANSFVEVNSGFNNFAKVLSITNKGKDELISPSLEKNKVKNKIKINYSEVNEKEKLLFKELNFFISEYNEQQKKAIICDSKKILCIAGAGSGKTSVLVKRIEFLIKYKSINPDKILAITFTRKAKQEMETRLAELGIRTNVETFNSFSESILRKYSNKIYDKNTRVMTYTDKIVALTSALENSNLDFDRVIKMYFNENQKRSREDNELSHTFLNDCFSILEYFKSKNKKLYDFSKEMNKNKEDAKLIFNICSFIEKHMDLQGLRDFTDQIMDCIKFFKEDKEYIPKFEHILVDEYQDVNDSQIELLSLLNSENLFCVGDPRQSIFGWRGGNINYIFDFQKQNPDSEIINLSKNYRSKRKIIDFMNLSIRDLGLADLENQKKEDGEIKILNFDSEEDEYDFVVKKILETGVERDEIFILARTNRQLNELSQKLKQKQIPHIIKTDEVKKPVYSKKGELTLATIHAIKGLEAEIVFVVGCNELNFPCKASDHPVLEFVKQEESDKEEEEKRLFYVAISRAKEKLYLTYSGKRPTYFINSDMMKILDKGWF